MRHHFRHFFILQFVCLWLLGCIAPGPSVLFTSATSPRERYLVEVHVGEAFGFGTHPVEVFVLDTATGADSKPFKFDLNNDGANLTQRNLALTMVGDFSAELCARGQQQADTLYTFTFPSTEPAISDGC